MRLLYYSIAQVGLVSVAVTYVAVVTSQVMSSTSRRRAWTLLWNALADKTIINATPISHRRVDTSINQWKQVSICTICILYCHK